MINTFQKKYHEIMDEKREEFLEAFEVVADPITKTCKIDRIKEIVGDLGLILAMDLDDAERFFDYHCQFIPVEINKDQVTFDNFLKLLKIHLKIFLNYEVRFSKEVVEKIENEIKGIFELFSMTYETPRTVIPIDNFEQLSQFFKKRTENQSYIKKTKALGKDFHYLLSEAQKQPKDPFVKYMLFLLKNQCGLTKFDFILILRKFEVVHLPK